MKKIAIFSAALVCFACNSGKITKDKAIEAAHVFVKEKLKSPDAAAFIEDNCELDKDSTYLVGGKVDGTNSFGAKVRERYIVKMKYLGGDYKQRESWQVDAVEVW